MWFHWKSLPIRKVMSLRKGVCQPNGKWWTVKFDQLSNFVWLPFQTGLMYTCCHLIIWQQKRRTSTLQPWCWSFFFLEFIGRRRSIKWPDRLTPVWFCYEGTVKSLVFLVKPWSLDQVIELIAVHYYALFAKHNFLCYPIKLW